MMEEQHEVRNYCCISHEFLKSASKAPNKVAVVYAQGGAGVVSEIQRKFVAADSDVSDEVPKVSDSGVPLFEGDEFLTYSDLLTAVENLSSRIHSILNGELDDPHLIRPEGNMLLDTSSRAQSNESLKPSISGTEWSVGSEEAIAPKIIGIYMVPSIEYIIAVLSVLRCGEAFLPLDPSWPRKRILSVVSYGVDLIVTCRSSCQRRSNYHQNLSKWIFSCSNCPLLGITVKECLGKFHDTSYLKWSCDGKNRRLFCYLMYTSGSSGKPKGVCGTEDGLLNRLRWMEDSYPSLGKEILLFKTSTSFIDHLQEFLGAILTSCSLVIPPYEDLEKKLFSIIHYVEAYSVSRLIAVPSLMRGILIPSQSNMFLCIRHSLKILALSGEVLSLSLWKVLVELLPETCILNLYGSTEVSGDCLYFDCKRLPEILETTSLRSVPIGIPIPNCDVLLVNENGISGQGEIYVAGVCLSIGYDSNPALFAKDFVKLSGRLLERYPNTACQGKTFFRTGDYAMQLKTGDFVFLGRKDRTLKINGQRICLEETESMLREHPNVAEASVVTCKDKDDNILLGAFVVSRNGSSKPLSSSIRKWMLFHLPVAMVPVKFFFVNSFPVTHTGKTDYVSLENFMHSASTDNNKLFDLQSNISLDSIKKAFCDALMVRSVGDDDDFFILGGNSIAAAHASHNLSINMRLLYSFSTPFKLLNALLEEDSHFNNCQFNSAGEKFSLEVKGWNAGSLLRSESLDKPFTIMDMQAPQSFSNACSTSKKLPGIVRVWDYGSASMSCSFSRCNKILFEGEYEVNDVCQASLSASLARNEKGCLQQLWKVPMDSCVDASPTIVFKTGDSLLFIGSHSKRFLCINAQSGFVYWEVELEGRIECTAAVVNDFSLVVVGCYKGNIYFLDFLTGNICWIFRTCGEVKSAPIEDRRRNLVWCASYDHNLYALHYIKFCCIYILPCGGSICSSPVMDEVNDILYVATTSCHLIALSLKASKFNILWEFAVGAPVFGPLSISPSSSNVIYCMVDGHVVVVDPTGCITWKRKTDGPLFCGPCVSHVFPRHVLVCSRNGSIYSFELENGNLSWEYNIGAPITASSYVDDNLSLFSSSSPLPDRLVCVSDASGRVHLLRVDGKLSSGINQSAGENLVEEFAHFDLQGDIFSSPVMIAGRIFVGCRDDHVHCLQLHLATSPWHVG